MVLSQRVANNGKGRSTPHSKPESYEPCPGRTRATVVDLEDDEDVNDTGATGTRVQRLVLSQPKQTLPESKGATRSGRSIVISDDSDSSAGPLNRRAKRRLPLEASSDDEAGDPQKRAHVALAENLSQGMLCSLLACQTHC